MPETSDLLSLPADVTSSNLFNAALTHRSMGRDNNERLEFLGDAVLGLVIANLLYRKFPDCDEGDLSRLRAHLVCKAKLAELANEANLSAYVQLGVSEKKSGGHYRASILADCLEAIIGAIYLLKGFDFTAQFLETLYTNQLEQLPQVHELKDPKTRLQEHLQSLQMEIPQYAVIEEWGEGNNKFFRVECKIAELEIRSTGEGKSKKKAEQEAARAIMKILSI